MPDKKYLIEIPGMPEGSGVWDSDKWERNKDAFMSDYPEANVFELGEYDAEDTNENDQIMLTFENDPDSSGVWDAAKWERNKEAFTADHPEAKVNRVRYVDYWGKAAQENRVKREELSQPDAERDARLADLGYYDDMSGQQKNFSLENNTIGLKPVSSAIEQNSVSGETTYHDPKLAEFYANDSAHTERMAEIARLDAEYDSNPSVVAQREWEQKERAEQEKYIDDSLASIRADINTEVNALEAGKGAFYKTASSQGMGDAAIIQQAMEFMKGKDAGQAYVENEKLETYASAAKLFEKAKQAYDVAGKGFWGATADVGMDKLRDLATQSDIEAYNQIGDILTRLETRLGSLNEVTDKDIESNLSKEEQALIKGFFAYNEAMSNAQQDMSQAYKGGKIFGESISFMLEFLATGGLAGGTGKAAGNAVGKGLVKWAAKAAKGTAQRAARTVATKAARALTSAAVGTLARTVAAPGTYQRMAEDSVKIEDGHLNRGKNAFKAFTDSYIENLSEISGGVIGKSLKMAGVNPSKILGGMSFGKVGKMLADNSVMQAIAKGGKALFGENGVLKKFGFNGIFEEVEEEYIGNLIRELTIQPGALEEMHKDGNFGAMIIGFAPMTLFGAGMSAVSIGAKNIEAANLGKKLRKNLSLHYTDQQIDHMMNLVSGAENADQVWEAIKPLTVGLSAEETQQLLQYGAFMAQNKAMLFAKKAQEDNLAQAKRAEAEHTYGKFWQENAEGAESVQLATLNDGRSVFVLSEPTADGVVSIIDAKTGEKGFTNVSNYKTQEVNGEVSPMTQKWSMDAYLEGSIAADRMTAEQARMTREYDEQVKNLQSQIQEGTQINLGTEGSPVILLATGKFVKDGVVAVDQTGNTHTVGWNQVADAMGQPIIVKTDQQVVDEEIAGIIARNAERRKKMSNATPAMTEAVNESAAQTSETVAQETKHIPLNEDGTVNEAAFWEQDPEGYAQWNDEQNQDGGADTIQQIEAAKAELTAMLNEAQRATLTSNPANRKAAKREVSRLAERLARLEALEQSYADRALAPLRERAKMWADLTGAPVHVLETEEELAAISSTAASENAKQGSRVRGFAKDGRAYIFLPGIKDIKEIDEVFFHEAVAHNGLKGLLGKENYDKLCEQVWNMMSQAARNQFIRYPGVNGDYLAAADEYIAHIAEKMGAGIAEAEEKTIWQKIVDFVRNVLREMGIELNMTEQELSDLLHQAYADLANNMAKAEQIATGEAMSAVEEASSEARQQYDALLEDLTPEEIEAVAQNDFNAAQEAYNAHLANAPKVEPGESSKAYVERKKAYNDELKRLEAELNAQQALMDEIAKAKQTETEEEAIEPVEDLDQVQQEDGTFRLSVVTYNDWTDNLGNQHKGTRTMVLERMVAMNFTDAEINDMMRKMDTAYEYMEKLRSLTNEDGSVRFDEFNEWAKATPMYKQVGRDFVKAITSLVSNGDYPINMELTTDCIKREAYTMLLNTLIKRGADLSAMGPGEIVTIQKMMKQYGIETACALCFVEGKRLQIVNWASQIVEDWNAALVEAGVETEEHFGFGKDGDAFIPAEEWRTHENKAEVAKVMKQLDEIDLLFRGIDPVQFKKQKAKNKKAVEKYKKEKAEAWAKRAKRPLSEWKPTDKQEAEIKKMAKEGLAPTYVNENMEEYRNAFNAMRNEWLEKHPGKDPLSFTPTKKQWEALGKIRNRQIDTVKAKMVRLIMEYPEMRKKMTLNDLLGSKGLMEIRQQHGQAYADLYSIILQRFGTGTPKPVQDAVPYDGELMTLSESAFKKANEIGGARLFSFSDFDITKVFDYMQMFFDLEANRQMLQSYTKEVAAVIIFGRSNAKFNISTLANAYVPQEVLDEYAKAGEAKQKEMRHKWAENAGLQVDEAGNITGINFSEEHSVSPAFAQQIFHDDARNKDCGAIMVGASVNHAIYSAAQAWIRMVIPFHLSGMPKAAQDKTDVKWYFDNTPFQSTRKKTKEGWSKIESSEDTFKLYDDMSAPGWNMRDKAKQYLAWCAEKGFRPKFDWGINSDYYRAYCEEYGYTPNQQIIDIMDADTTDGVWNQYYKFLTDFTAYKPVFNEQGEMIDESPSPQLPVVANFDFSELEREVLFEGENSMLGRREENIQKAERHMDALAAQVVPYLDGEITEDEMGLRDDVFYKSSTDAENYLEEIEKQMRANKAVPEWFKNIRRSQELDQNNSPFILAPDGGIDFGEILPIHHLPAAPIRLSEGDAENGYIHINNRHGKEIQKQGFNSIEDFVKFVVDNFTRIQEGSAYENETGGQNQTYLVQLQDKHNNTLFIQLSRDGQYWNVNSAGVFKKNYGNNKKNIWSASEVQNDNSAVVDNGLQSEPNADTGSTSNGTPSDVSKGKDSENLVNTSDNTRLSVIAPQMDAEYLAAVEAGDMKTAQRMVLEAAKLAMPNTKVVDENGNPLIVYHGTSADFNVFDENYSSTNTGAKNSTLGFYFTPLRSYAEKIAKGDSKVIKSVFLNIQNPLELGYAKKFDGSYHNGREAKPFNYEDSKNIVDGLAVIRDAVTKKFGSYTQENVSKWKSLVESYYDGIYVMTGDTADFTRTLIPSMQYIAFFPSQIKSADPVTYDNNGNVIPLSQRFNPANEDIRFSARTDEQRQALFDKAKAQFGLTNNFKVAGYMLPDGSLLDFSEANNGGNPNQRSLDHREIEGIIMDEGIEYDSRWMYLADFMNEGAIRLLPEYAGINLMKAPTKEQRQKLFDFIYKYNGEVILEIADERLNNVAYVEYDRRTSPSRIFRDIDGYFNEGIVPQQDVRFSIANENQAIFVSNAARAVEGIKMEKATPEQWLKMIEKNGGLKAGEDKWMGLSDWLKASDKKTLTKAEVLDFINENMIIIEEQHYGEIDETQAIQEQAAQSIVNGASLEELQEIINEHAESASRYDAENEDEDFDLDEWLMDIMVDEYGDDFGVAYTIEDGTIEFADIDWWDISQERMEDRFGVRPIDDTRLEYTTLGLQNFHEIALTVPTILPWETSDYTHFGDAGDGRAVAWIRFGETRINDESAIETARRAVDEASERERAILDKRGKAESEEEYRSLYPALEEAIKAREEAVWAWSRAKDNAVRKKVLVIDEIQSNRHQEGRKRGYKDIREIRAIQKRKAEIDAEIKSLAGAVLDGDRAAKRQQDALFREHRELSLQRVRGEIPDAPFEKNWPELAMKRMLRYAAEEGYDVIAWTKGEQQAERYGLSNIVESILAEGDWYDSGSTKQEEKVIRNIVITMKSGGNKYYAFNKDGVLINSEYEGKHLSELVGKELAEKLINAKPYEKISEDGLRIGGEGMKGFYDKMLPAFMNKYGKKWGVKVEDIDLSHLESGLTMHSVPVTEEMKASVMEGQVMFSVRTVNQTAQEFHNDALTDFRRQFNLIQPTAVVDINDRAALAEALGEELSDEKYQLILDGVNNGGRSFYDDDTKRIAIFALEEQRTSAEVSENIFHENTHAIISKNPELLELGQWLWDNAKPGAREKIKSAILEAGYPEWQDANEMLSRYTGAILAIGRAGEVLNMLPADQKKHWEFILKEFGYEPEREDGERIRRYDADSRRAGFFRKMSRQKMSDNGAAARYSAEERRVINELFPGAIQEETRFSAEEVAPEDYTRFSVVTDPALIEELENGPKIKVYRAMQLIDGKLYPPMSAKVDGKMREPIELGKWEQAEERPDLADEKGYFKLDKGNKTSLKARYNPYFHTSPTPLNDQFASAQARPELVTVEVEVPESELTSGYKAEKAKDSVGKMEWKAGVVQSKLSGTRTVILSRWDKPVRIVPDSEVADVIVKMFEGKDITMPSNVVTPSLRAELEKRGVPFVETDNSGKPTKEDVRFSVVTTPTDKVVAEGMQLSLQDFAQLAGNIFQDMPESFRKEAIEETFRNGMDMQSAIFQIPARLAEKTEWTDEDKNLARIIREKVQDAVDESGAVSDRPLTTKEALWMLYRSTAANGSDLISAARRSLVAHNLGFDPRSERIREMADDHIRYSVVRNNMIDSATDMYNYEASLWTSRLKESWLDMNQSVISLQNALAEASGKPIESWEDVVLALNQLSSKSYADKKKYMRDFLEPLWDVVLKITKATDYRIEDIERYMMLKHALERNLAFAKRDAREYYETAFRQSIAAIEGNESLSDADKQKQIDKAQKTLDKHLTDIDAGTDAKFLEFREKDYGGLTSMFTDFDRNAVGKRSSYKSEESYQQAVIAATRPRYDNVADMEDAAKDEVDVMENDLAGLAAELWDKINAATKEVLRHQHASGMITTEQYNAVRNMFQHYVPLRGFADNTAEDMYSYYMNNSSNGFAMPIIGAKGRKTKAESPLGWIGTMAESAIQADNKNDAKLRLYYALLNRPDTGVLSIAETWYEYTGQNDANGRKIFAPVYPPATGKAMTADELRQHMDTWESSMMQKQAAGNAFKGNQSVNLRGSVVFQDTKEDKEHIIRVKVAGKDYSILVNGNPRAAQAINGLLNPDANVGPVGEWIGSLRRNMSALMTSFSPLFWVSNYQRDLLSSFMRTSESEGWKQAFKYLNNRRKAWRVASYIYKYDNGTLGNSYYENLYKEFAENGGITGYTSLTTNKEYEKLLEDYAQFADKPIRKWIKNAWNNFMGFGEAIEQVSRFAAFITAREAGKSIEEAVNAAKEVSVNFNRKGSAKPLSLDEIDKLKTKDGKPLNMAQKAVAIVLTAMPKGMKELYFFFNASIQALSSSAKLAKQSPGKATAWAGMYMGLSMALAAINYLISGDDDEEEYLDLPDYVRRSNALVKISDEYYLKWSLPQEMRPFYATADIILGKAAGNMPHKNVGKEVALAMAEWLPVNPFGTDDPLLSLVPDFAAPLAEIKANKNFVGGKIYDDMAFKSEGEKVNIPAFRKATSKTGKVYVDVAEVLNAISGGDEVQKGAININPAVVEHLVEGYGGGLYDFAKMMVSFPAMLLSDEDLEVRDIPFVNKVIMSVDETNMYTHTNEVFYHYRDIAENAERVEKEYRNSDDPSRADAYRQEEDWRIHLLFEQYDAELKESKDKLKNAADKEEEDLLKQSQNAVRELLLNDIATGKEPDPVLALNDAIKEISKEISAIKKPFNDAEKKRKKAKESGDMEGAQKAKKERDEIRKSDAYKTADKAGKDLKELKDLLDEIKSTSLPEDRDSLIAKFNDDYQALKKKLESK